MKCLDIKVSSAKEIGTYLIYDPIDSVIKLLKYNYNTYTTNPSILMVINSYKSSLYPSTSQILAGALSSTEQFYFGGSLTGKVDTC